MILFHRRGRNSKTMEMAAFIGSSHTLSTPASLKALLTMILWKKEVTPHTPFHSLLLQILTGVRRFTEEECNKMFIKSAVNYIKSCSLISLF